MPPNSLLLNFNLKCTVIIPNSLLSTKKLAIKFQSIAYVLGKKRETINDYSC